MGNRALRISHEVAERTADISRCPISRWDRIRSALITAFLVSVGRGRDRVVRRRCIYVREHDITRNRIEASLQTQTQHKQLFGKLQMLNHTLQDAKLEETKDIINAKKPKTQIST